MEKKNGKRWYVIYTKPRAEKKAADRLREAGFEIYCPLREEVRQWSDRKKKIKVPVFSSYVFIRLGSYSKERIEVLNIPNVARFLWWLGKPAIVRDKEMRQMKEFLEEYKDSNIRVDFSRGEQVEIKHGPFREQEGVIIDMDRRKAILQINSLGMALKAELPLSMLKKSNRL